MGAVVGSVERDGFRTRHLQTMFLYFLSFVSITLRMRYVLHRHFTYHYVEARLPPRLWILNCHHGVLPRRSNETKFHFRIARRGFLVVHERKPKLRPLS